MNNRWWIIVGIIALAVLGFIVLGSQRQPQQQVNTQTTAPTQTTSPSVSPEATAGAQVKTFEVSGKPFEFSIKEMRVKRGDTVKIVFTNTQGFHDFGVDEFNVRTKQIQAGQSDTVEFVADKAGTFEYYCSVGNHRQMGMKGTLIVE